MATRTVISSLGKEIQPAIESFIKTNAQSAESLSESTIDAGAEDLSQAIAYGIAKALSGVSFQIAMATGICPPSGGPFGSLISSQLSALSTEG